MTRIDALLRAADGYRARFADADFKVVAKELLAAALLPDEPVEWLTPGFAPHGRWTAVIYLREKDSRLIASIDLATKDGDDHEVWSQECDTDDEAREACERRLRLLSAATGEGR